jgi:hypothetical protein
MKTENHIRNIYKNLSIEDYYQNHDYHNPHFGNIEYLIDEFKNIRTFNNKHVLDLCCGNGEISNLFPKSFVPEMFIARALSPALVNSVKIEEHPKNGEKGKAVVTINSEQKSKAIGKAGLNIRLASMLTKYDIEIVEIETGVTTSNLETKKDEKISDASSLEALFK